LEPGAVLRNVHRLNSTTALPQTQAALILLVAEAYKLALAMQPSPALGVTLVMVVAHADVWVVFILVRYAV